MSPQALILDLLPEDQRSGATVVKAIFELLPVSLRGLYLDLI
jgi:hypothetical protein